MTDKKPKHPPISEEQRRSWRKLWPDLPGGIKPEPKK